MTPSRPAAPAPPAPPPTLGPLALSLDDLSAHWRVAFNTAEDALGATTGCGISLHFEESELSEFRARVARGRASVAELLEWVARDEHITLHRALSAPRASKTMLGLTNDTLACVFELDGVLTPSAAIHAAAWAETFNEFLLRRAERTAEHFAPFQPFDPAAEYRQYLDGKPRITGIHAFLASRGIRLRDGRPDDPPDTETVHGLANRKNIALRRRLDDQGVTAFADSRRYLEAAHEVGLRCAVVSASANTATIIERAGLTSLLDEQIDGNTIKSQRLRAKPAPDTLLAACRQLGTTPQQTALFETTLDGIHAGRTATFALIIAVEATGQPQPFRAHGANLVVTDLGALLDPTLAAPSANRRTRRGQPS
jgi:beta-phosphoglucomutase-like phosphatase (HAD superfamily)